MARSKNSGMNFQGGIRPGAYDGDQALVAITSVEMNIRRGNQYSLNLHIPSLASGADYWIAAVIGSKPIILKTRQIATNGGMIYTPRRNAVFTTGTEIPSSNLNGLSASLSEAKLYNVDAGNISNAGVSFEVIRSTTGTGSNREQGIFNNIGIERVIPPNTQILINFNNTDNKAIYIVYDLTWYEGPVIPSPDNPL